MDMTRNLIKNLKDKKYRKENAIFLLEGEKFCRDILKANIEILYTITTNKSLKNFPIPQIQNERIPSSDKNSEMPSIFLPGSEEYCK